jgi:hypothetical protein
MRLAAAALFVVVFATAVFADDTLPATRIEMPAFAVAGLEPMDFDLIDLRAEQRNPAKHVADSEPHTIFVIKRHFGAAFGYDNGVVHTGVGLYLTVAEMGRWNFGVPSVEVGFGRYPIWDGRSQRVTDQQKPTLMISLASVHYRVGYLRSLGYTFYLNLEQIYDMRTNMAGSQFGFSFARK